MAGDSEPEVIGQCFHSLLALAPAEAVAFVGRYLRAGGGDVQMEAAIALGQSKEPGALELLQSFWTGSMPPEVRKGVVIALGASPLRPAAEWLWRLAAEHGRAELGVLANRALASSRFREEFSSASSAPPSLPC